MVLYMLYMKAHGFFCLKTVDLSKTGKGGRKNPCVLRTKPERRRRQMHKIFASIRSVKAIFAIVAAVVVLGAAAGGTLAWVYARTNPVQNTFTTEGVNITLTESDSGDNDENAATNTYAMMPGAAIAKDPVVTVDAYSMPVWLFVQLTKSDNLDDFITYTVASSWQALPGAQDVYYCEVAQAGAPQAFPVFENDQVFVREDVTHEMLRSLTQDSYPQLHVSAYAVQREGMPTALDAWAAATGETLIP